MNTHTDTTLDWTTTTLEQWHNATSAMRKELMAKELVKAERAIRKAREGKVQPGNVFNVTQQEKARSIAKVAVNRALYNLKDIDGLENPYATDPIFGHDSDAAKEAKKAAQPTPNKYGGKCATCGGWVEANAGTLVKKGGRFSSQHIGECPKAAPRANSYAGTCGHCGQNVKPQEGRIEKSTTGGWLTFHLDGKCPEAAAAPEATETATDGIDLSGLVAGYYAVPGGSRLKVAISHGKGKWANHTFVKDAAEYGAGKRYGMQRPGQSYQGGIKPELEAILKDPKAAMVAYGKLVGACGACGRKLEDAASVAAGIGPVCSAKWDA